MKEKVVHASDIKPDFTKVKAAWSLLLSNYYTKDGELKEEYVKNVKCPHCYGDDFYDQFNLNGFKHVTCKKCDSVYVNPRLRDEYIDKLYTDSYYSEMFAKSMIPFFDKRKKLLGQNKYNQILNYSVRKGSVLDIGCGVGELIDVFKDNGWESDVVELNPVAIQWLESRGHNVNKVHFEDYDSDKKYDVVMAWNVIEHVLDPKGFVKKAYDLLKPGGIFVSEVPHGNSLLIDYCRKSGKDPLRILQGEQHIMLYSKKAYEELHLKSGFKKIFVKTNGLDYGTILNINNIKANSDLILEMQSLIDSKDYGDLMRGFWVKE